MLEGGKTTPLKAFSNSSFQNSSVDDADLACGESQIIKENKDEIFGDV